MNQAYPLWKRCLLWLIEVLVIIGGFIIAASIIYGIIHIFNGLGGLFSKGGFIGEPFWRAVGGRETHKGVASWDIAWWLFLLIPFFTFGLMALLGDAATWLKKSPEERIADWERENGRRLGLTGSEIDERITEAVEKANKPMSGWRRLWIVLSILFGVPTFFIVYDVQEKISAVVTRPENWTGFSHQNLINAVYGLALYERRELRACQTDTVRVQFLFSRDYQVSCNRRKQDTIFFSLLWSLVPAIFMLIVGRTARWVYRGFRPASDGEASQSI